MYISPKKYKCHECSNVIEYTSGGYIVPIYIDVVTGNPICPKCLERFLAKNVPVMEEIEDENT